MIRVIALLTLVAISPSTSPAKEPASYFLVIYGAESEPYRTRFTHTWATVLRLCHSDSGTPLLELNTISWMPATLKIRPLALQTEPGVNLSLDETFAWIDSIQAEVSIWGPFAISESQYVNFLRRKNMLESGQVAYRASGGTRRDLHISNCGQSFTRTSEFVGYRYQPTPSPGERGTSILVRRYLREGAIQPVTHPFDIFARELGFTRPNTTRRNAGERVPLFD